MWLGLAAIIVIADLFIVFQATLRFGLCPTVAGLILVGMVGAQLVKRSGTKMVQSFQDSIARNEPPPEGVLEGLLLLTAGIAFAVPGVITDVIAFVLLVPPARRAIARVLRARLERAIDRGTVQVVDVRAAHVREPVDYPSRGPQVIDVEGVDITPHDDVRRLPP